MDSFVDRLIRGGDIPEPEFLSKIFRKKFKRAVHVEWSQHHHMYEAIFYIDQIEYIAIFNEDGELVEYKMFLPVEHLPGSVRKCIEEKGEIMTVVMVNQGNKILYEAIIRVDKKLRKLVVLSSLGKIVDEKGL